MEKNEPTKAEAGLMKITWGVGLITFLRVALGALFAVSSVSKLQYPHLFIEAVEKYGILPDSLAHVFGTVLPWAELFIGCALILGIFTTLVSGVTVVMVVSFIIANIYSLFSPMLGEPCQCLGQLVRLNHATALAIDFAMLFVAGLLLYMRDKSEVIGVWRLLKRYFGRLPRAGLYALGLVVIAVAMVVSFVLIPAPKSDLEVQIDDALAADRVVVLLLLSGDPQDFLDEIRMIAELREEYSPWVYFRSVDVDHEEEAVAKELFDVSTFPTLLVISGTDRDGYVIDGRFGGAEDRDALVASIEDALASKE